MSGTVHIESYGRIILDIEPAPLPLPLETIRCIVTAEFDRFTVTAEGNHMVYKLPDDKYVNIQIKYVDAKGRPATIDGDVAWASSDDQIATVTVLSESADTTKAQIMPTGLGQVQITATADADLGSGVRELITTFDVEVIGGEAVAGTIEPVGEPIPIP